MNTSLASGDEAKGRSLLGAGDDTTTGARQTGGATSYSQGVVARVAVAIAQGAYSILGGVHGPGSGGHYQSGGITSQGFNTGIIER